jgi:hypothetical protein
VEAARKKAAEEAYWKSPEGIAKKKLEKKRDDIREAKFIEYDECHAENKKGFKDRPLAKGWTSIEDVPSEATMS